MLYHNRREPNVVNLFSAVFCRRIKEKQAVIYIHICNIKYYCPDRGKYFLLVSATLFPDERRRACCYITDLLKRLQRGQKHQSTHVHIAHVCSSSTKICPVVRKLLGRNKRLRERVKKFSQQKHHGQLN